MKTKLLLVAVMGLGVSALAQNRPQTTVVVEHENHTRIFRVTVVGRSVQAVSYRHHSGSTKVNFQGTDLMPLASGEAKVNSKRGAMEVEVELANLQEPTTFGGEYLTYVLWAISPEGRAVNLGEVLVSEDHRSKLNVTTDLQAFALIVTAEPYYAVRQPSNVVVLENVVRGDTRGSGEAVNIKYDLLERGGYIPTGYNFNHVVLNSRLPLEFFEARNALRIAQSEGAETYASESYRHAAELMNRVDELAERKHLERKSLIALAREVVQTAEDAREIAVKRMTEEGLADERQTSSAALAQSRSQTDDATREKEHAQSAQARAEFATAEAESDRMKAQAATARAESDSAQARSDSDKAKADLADNQESSAMAISAAQADADQSRLTAQAAQQNAQNSEADKAAMRARLSEQLNIILETRDSARGLIISMSDVLFDTGKYSLKSGAREKLAKVAGILLSYPDLNIAVGGYTDNVGSDEMNQVLSENRARSVRDYLVQQGVATQSVSATGFGNTSPVTTNDTSEGRQQNRRVELLVSGDSIGNTVNATTGSLR